MKIKSWTIAALALSLTMVTGSALAQSCTSSTADSAPDSRYQMNADGTVVDLRTGLMWMRCAMGQTWDAQQGACKGESTAYTWKDALAAVQVLDQGNGFAGFKDWRLPNVRELSSLTRFHCTDPAINLKAFPQTPSKSFWTSTPVASSFGSEWAVNFKTGQAGYDFYSNTYPIRLVRAGAFAP